LLNKAVERKTAHICFRNLVLFQTISTSYEKFF